MGESEGVDAPVGASGLRGSDEAMDAERGAAGSWAGPQGGSLPAQPLAAAAAGTSGSARPLQAAPYDLAQPSLHTTSLAPGSSDDAPKPASSSSSSGSDAHDAPQIGEEYSRGVWHGLPRWLLEATHTLLPTLRALETNGGGGSRDRTSLHPQSHSHSHSSAQAPPTSYVVRRLVQLAEVYLQPFGAVQPLLLLSARLDQ